MSIRQATETDITIIVELGLKFVAEFPHYFPIEVSCEDFGRTIHGLITNTCGGVVVAENPEGIVVGVLAAISQPVFYNIAEQYVQELLFYVLPNYRKTSCGVLMKLQIVEWAKSVGAYGIGFGWLSGTISKEFYLSRGYVERELHLSKVF